MAKKQKKDGTMVKPRTVHGATLREENVGKKRVDVSSMLRMEHLQKLATWAAVDAGIAPLGALFGHRLAASAEAEGVPLDPSTFVCHRCESILQPGFNCTVRIEKNTKKARRRKKSHVPFQNNVVYKCHFCSYHNLLRGTQRGYVKTLLPSRPRPDTEAIHQCPSMSSNSGEGLKDKEKLDQNTGEGIPSTAESIQFSGKALEAHTVSEDISLERSPLTPLEILANSAKRKRKRNRSTANKFSNSADSPATLHSVEGTAGSSKRKRKGWSSLRVIAESNEAQSSRSLKNFAIPFILQTTKTMHC